MCADVCIRQQMLCYSWSVAFCGFCESQPISILTLLKDYEKIKKVSQHKPIKTLQLLNVNKSVLVVKTWKLYPQINKTKKCGNHEISGIMDFTAVNNAKFNGQSWLHYHFKLALFSATQTACEASIITKLKQLAFQYLNEH